MAITPKKTKDVYKVPRPGQPEFENKQLRTYR